MYARVGNPSLFNVIINGIGVKAPLLKQKTLLRSAYIILLFCREIFGYALLILSLTDLTKESKW